MLSAAAAATAWSMRTMPSTIEYSLCRRKWTNRAREPDACARRGEGTIASTDALAGSAATGEADRESSAFMGYNFTRIATPVRLLEISFGTSFNTAAHPSIASAAGPLSPHAGRGLERGSAVRLPFVGDDARPGLHDSQSGGRSTRHAIWNAHPSAAARQSATAGEHQSPGLPARVPAGLCRRLRERLGDRAQGRHALQERQPIPRRLAGRQRAVPEAVRRG